MMFSFDFFQSSFKHGVHPSSHKEKTTDLAIQRVPFIDLYVMPLDQHLGVPAKPVVAVGDHVERGQLIAEPGAFVSTALHSPVTGTISDIAPKRNPNGHYSQAIEIKADPYATQQFNNQPAIDWTALSAADFVNHIQAAGIVGMGGAAFPSHVKFSLPEGQIIKHLLVNGAECEPYLTNDHRLMIEYPERLLQGTEIVRQILGAGEASIGVESNKPEAIETLSRLAGPFVNIVALPVKYPQGAEKMLIKAVYNKEVPAGHFPRDIGINVNNVGTIVAIADYFNHQMPLIERIVTVSGPGVVQPANLIVPLGTPVREVLNLCGGLKPETREIIMGGPMMGVPIASLDAPILKGTSGILAFTEKETRQPKEYACIRCGRCLEACPYFLNPSKLARLSQRRLYNEMMDYQVMDCVECAACTYACPSGIPIAQLIRAAKSDLRKQKGKPN